MSEQKIKVGQVWRRRKGGVLVRITQQGIGYSGASVDDWLWSAIEGTAHGWCFGRNIKRAYDLEGDQGRVAL